MPPKDDPQDIGNLLSKLKEIAGTNLLGPTEKGLKGILQITDELLKKVGPKAISDSYKAIDEQIVSIQRKMGQMGTYSSTFKQNMADAAKNMGQFGISATDAYANVNTMQTAFMNATGRNAEINAKTLSEIQTAATASGKDSAEIMKSFIAAGRSLEDVTKLTETSMNRASELGVSGQKATQNMYDNFSAMDKFSFKGGAEGFARMAADSVNMNSNMKSVLNFSENALDLDKANQMANAFNRMGATQEALLDPIRMAGLAQNDPAELQKQIGELTKSFVHMNEEGQIEVLPGAREKFSELNKITSISTDELIKMGKSAFELDEKMGEISFPTEEDAMNIRAANQATLGAGGEFKVSKGGEQFGIGEPGAFDVSKLREEGAPKELSELVKSQMTLSEKQFANTEAISENISGQLAVSENLLKVMGIYDKTQTAAGTAVRGSINDKGFQNLQGNLIKAFQDAMKEKDGNKAKEVFSKEAAEALSGAINPEKGITEAKPKFDEIVKTAEASFPDLIQSIKELIATMKNEKITPAKDFLKTKDGKFSLLPEDGIIAGTNVEKIMDFVKNGGKKLVEKTKDMAKTTGEMAKTVGKTVQEKVDQFQKIQVGKEQSYEPTKSTTSLFKGRPNTPSETELSGQDLAKKGDETKNTQESGKVGGEITLNLKFTADSNSAGFASQIVEVFKNNTELQQTITTEIAKVSSGQGTYKTESFDGKGSGKSKVTAV